MDTHAKCFDGVLHPAQLSSAVRSHVMNPTPCVDLSYFFAAGGAARCFLHTNGIFTDFRNGWCACYSTVCTISLFSFDPGRRAKTLHRGSSAGFWASCTIISLCLEAVLRTGMNLKRVPCRVNLLIPRVIADRLFAKNISPHCASHSRRLCGPRQQMAERRMAFLVSWN